MRRVFRKRRIKAPCSIVADRRSDGVGWHRRCDRLTHRPITSLECQRTCIALINRVQQFGSYETVRLNVDVEVMLNGCDLSNGTLFLFCILCASSIQVFIVTIMYTQVLENTVSSHNYRPCRAQRPFLADIWMVTHHHHQNYWIRIQPQNGWQKTRHYIT